MKPTRQENRGFPRALATLALLAFGGVTLWRTLNATDPHPLDRLLHLVAAPTAILCAVGLWFGIRNVRYPAALSLALLAADAIGHATLQPGQRWQFVIAAVLLFLLWDIWQLYRPRPGDAANTAANEGPLISLVLLLRRPRHLDAALLARYCESAWGGSFEILNQDEPEQEKAGASNGQFVAGKPPILVAAFAQRLHLIHCSDQPYFEDPLDIANKHGEARLRHVLEENRGWLAVDLVRREGESIDPADHYPRLARLIAELAGPDCQAIYQPDEGRFNHWDESLEAKLRSGDISGVFADMVNPPVLEVGDDDQRMVAAIDEARRRWPEFVSAFHSGNAGLCSVKAPLSHEGHTEYIWITVDRIADNLIEGRLGNDPVDLGSLHIDSPVSVPTSEIADWVYFRGEEPVGLFSVQALQQIQAERRTRA